MLRISSLFGLLALIGALTVVSAAPAAAEMFTCHDRPGQVLFSYSGTPDQYIRRQRRYSRPRYRSSYRGYSSSRYRQRRHATYYGSSRYWNGR